MCTLSCYAGTTEPTTPQHNSLWCARQRATVLQPRKAEGYSERAIKPEPRDARWCPQEASLRTSGHTVMSEPPCPKCSVPMTLMRVLPSMLPSGRCHWSKLSEGLRSPPPARHQTTM